MSFSKHIPSYYQAFVFPLVVGDASGLINLDFVSDERGAFLTISLPSHLHPIGSQSQSQKPYF